MKKIYCRSTYFCQLLKSPVRTEAGGTQKHVLAPGTLGWRTLTVLPQAVACSGEAWFFACCLHFHLASASVCWFPLLCHIPHAISVWMSIFSRATLQSQFTAVINGFAIPLLLHSYHFLENWNRVLGIFLNISMFCSMPGCRISITENFHHFYI